MSGQESAYSALAVVYDRLGHHDYRAWGDYLTGLLLDMDLQPGSKLIDAACGTGGISLELIKSGFSVLGIDISQQMLTEAAAKAAKAGAPITFVKQDIRAMRVHRPVDGIICACDGVNYLLEPNDLRQFFCSARKSLKKGGALLFDVSSEEKLAAMDGQLYGEETDDTAYLWTNALDRETMVITMDITLFVRHWEYWRRENEVHQQRIWTEKEIADALTQCGYELRAVYGAFTKDKPKPGCDRLQFVAQAV